MCTHCYNGEILSIAMDNNMKKELCIRTLNELKSQYGKKLRGAIFLGDRGSQYTSEAFKTTLQKIGLRQSLSGTGHCFDNARMESFFSTLKKEKIYRISAYKLTYYKLCSLPSNHAASWAENYRCKRNKYLLILLVCVFKNAVFGEKTARKSELNILRLTKKER